MLTEFVKFFQGETVLGSHSAENKEPFLMRSDTSFASLEEFAQARYRERYSMGTSSIDAFVDYTNKRTDYTEDNNAGILSTITSVDPDRCVARAIFNADYDGEAGHCDDTALCVLKALPMWAFLMSIGAEHNSHSQREVIDVIRDWHDYMPDYTALVGSFTKLTIEGMSKVDAEEKDFGRKRSAMEEVSMKSDGGEVPSDINVQMTPYDGFELRNVQIGVSALIDRNDKISIRLRVRGFEALKLLIAEEFADKLKAQLRVAPIIGTIQAA